MGYYLGLDLYAVERVMAMHVDEVQGQLTADRLLHEAGIHRAAWLSRPAGRVLGHMGHWLLRVGQRLEQSEPRSPHERGLPAPRAAAGLGVARES